MILDARPLDFEFVPDDLKHREGATDHLSSCLAPIAEGRSGQDVLVWGQPGVGKTTLVRHMGEQLRKETPHVRVGEVNCRQESSQTGVLYTLVSDLGIGTFPREAASQGKCLDVLRDVDDQVVVILDEVDTLPQMELVATLYGTRDVTMLMTCIDETQLLSDTGRRVQDRLRTAASVHLEPYSRDAIADIVWSRADAALKTGAIDEPTVDTIADRAAGNARTAVSLLATAVDRAREDGHDALSPGLIEAVFDDAAKTVRERNREKLGSHQRLLLDIVREHGAISAGDLHEEFERRSSRVIDKSQRRLVPQSLAK